MNTSELCDFIVRRASEEWRSEKYPYMLSNISPDLRANGVEYKELIYPETLKQFIVGKLSERLTIVVHSSKRAKIGLIPKGERFSFEDNSQETTSDVAQRPERKARPERDKEVSFYNKRTVIQFISLINRLEPEDMCRVNVPIDVLSKLMNMQ